MKKTAERVPDLDARSPYPVLKCPFCGATTVVNDNMPWCASCQVEYYESRKPDENGRRRYVFDDKRKTPRYAWGKALNAAPVRIGKPK